MKLPTPTIPATLALLAGCATVQVTSYDEGTVTTSPVSFRASAPPLLVATAARTYQVAVAGANLQRPVEISAFRYHGMPRAPESTQADVLVSLELGSLEQGEPAALEFDDRWYPGFEVSIPYGVVIEKSDGTKLCHRSNRFTTTLTFRNLASFASRAEALAELDTVRELAAERIEERARTLAFSAAKDDMEELGRGLFVERRAYVDVPVVRAAAGVDLEAAYRLLAGANDPAQTRQALAAYEERGIFQLKPDGTPNRTGNYGVACGIAAARLMLLDFAGAWQWCKLASSFLPGGKEVLGIQRAILAQEQVSGVRVIPDGEREGLAALESEPVRSTLGTPGR